ncbi:MAG: 50S ribosomal protein L6 [Desulfobacteraceae bacterium]|nr:MAG: 50S ribosomal protein L6 [Desulfobacteraceae bacterium]
MSRVGKKPIPIQKEVQAVIKDNVLNIKGPKGNLDLKIHPKVDIHADGNQILISVKENDKEAKSLHGLYRALVANMVKGVTTGFEKTLEIVGVGYRAELSGRDAIFHIGYSHPVVFTLPEGIDAVIEKTKVTLKGIDKEKLGRIAAKIRGFKKPEPYKGKGIKYSDEHIRRKAGKTGAK